MGRGRARAALALDGDLRAFAEFQRLGWNYFRDPDGDPIDKPSSLAEQLAWMAEAGFAAVAVAENLRLAVSVAANAAALSSEQIVDLFPQMAGLLDRPAAALSRGERQLLALTRACIRSPRLLLLDELTEGVQPSIVEEIAERLKRIRDQGATSMVIVDQELPFVASLATRILVMQKGQIAREVSPRELDDPHLLGDLAAH